jgi:hypothetical protein
MDDWQLKKNEHSYETSKYQIDLIASVLDEAALKSTARKRVRHFVSQPGICATNISENLIFPFLQIVKKMAFYLVSIPACFSSLSLNVTRAASLDLKIIPSQPMQQQPRRYICRLSRSPS